MKEELVLKEDCIPMNMSPLFRIMGLLLLRFFMFYPKTDINTV